MTEGHPVIPSSCHPVIPNSMNTFARLLAILAQRCPVCLQGRVFYSLLGMHKTCPRCGILFEREHGYFLNAMLIAYVLGFLVIVPTAVYLYRWDVSTMTFSLFIIAELIVLWPLIFRYSRLLWMHADQMMDPRQLVLKDQ